MGNLFKIFIIEKALTLILKLIYLTCKKNFIGEPLPKEPCVVVFWHGKLAMMVFAYEKFWQNKSAKVMISEHKDGEIIARVIRNFGIEALRGSSSKGASRVLIEAFRTIDAGIDVIITPDGPRGPYRSVANGASIIAQKKGVKVYGLSYQASKFWQFRSWDKMELPKPFSTIEFSLTKALDLSNLSLEEANLKISELLK